MADMMNKDLQGMRRNKKRSPGLTGHITFPEGLPVHTSTVWHGIPDTLHSLRRENPYSLYIRCRKWMMEVNCSE